MASCFFCSFALGQLATLQFLQNWTTAAGSCVISACWEDWTAAAGLSLVFAKGLTFDKEDWAHPQRTIAKQVHIPHPLIHFLFHYLWWVVDKNRAWTFTKVDWKKIISTMMRSIKTSRQEELPKDKAGKMEQENERQYWGITPSTEEIYMHLYR